MNKQEITSEIAALEADNRAMILKTTALSAAGSTIAVILANKHKRSMWGKVGYFFAGATLARSAAALVFAGKAQSNVARINVLNQQLHELNINL